MGSKGFWSFDLIRYSDGGVSELINAFGGGATDLIRYSDGGVSER